MQGDAVLVIRRKDGPDHAAFFLGELAEIVRGPSPLKQVFIVVTDEDLDSVLATTRPLGRIAHPDMWGALA
jgi:hypothetical protein